MKSLILGLFLISSTAFAKTPASPITTSKLVKACENCHGKNVIYTLDTYPVIYGQNSGYLRRQLENFKTGARHHAFMNNVASQLTKEQIDALVNHFSRTISKIPGTL